MATLEVWISSREIGNLAQGGRFVIHLSPPPKPPWWENSHTKKWIRANWTKMYLDLSIYKLLDNDVVLGILTFERKTAPK